MLRGARPNWLIELVEVMEYEGSYRLIEFYVNPRHVVSVEDHMPTPHLIEETQRIGLAKRIEFSTITLKEYGTPKRVIVVGSARSISEKINNRRGLLKG